MLPISISCAVELFIYKQLFIIFSAMAYKPSSVLRQLMIKAVIVLPFLAWKGMPIVQVYNILVGKLTILMM